MPQSIARPSPETERKRNTVRIGAERVDNITSTDFPGHYPGEDHSWSIEKFRQGLHIKFHQNSPRTVVFSLIGVDASLANAFRRILLSEIPILAIEDCFIYQNTSIVQDEVLAHRLGLIPLKANKTGLRQIKWRHKATDEQEVDPATGMNTIVLKLKVQCTWQDGGKDRAKKGETDPALLYKDAHIYAHQVKYFPVGEQKGETSELGSIESLHPDILIAKMRPDQEIELEMHAIKGIGADHAKFSPVATASYRLLPTIDITAPILGDDARKFAKCFPEGVIGLEDVTAIESKKQGSGYEGKKGEMKAVVKDAIRDTVSRECLRHDEFKNKVKLGRQRDHFIFSVESTGQYDSDELFVDSVRILREKCARLKRKLSDLREIG